MAKRPQIRNGKKYSNEKKPVDNKTVSKVEQGRISDKCDFSRCNVSKKCGACQYIDISYDKQLEKKQMYMEKLLGKYGKVLPIIDMKSPDYYRNKVHHVFAADRKGNVLDGCYEANSHRVVNIDKCFIEDEKSQEIIATIKSLLKSFKVSIYNEDRGFGLLRHVLIRRGFSTGEIMVVLVISNPIFPSKNNFVKALRKVHPEITTVVLNINDKKTSMVLGERNITIYGPGFIKDKLCGITFKLSPSSFYQVNPVQTEKLYSEVIKFASLTGAETVIDAYCGIGTIGLCAASKVKEVIGIELNADAVRDAKSNAKENGISNAHFYQGDASEFMTKMAKDDVKADVVFMDPPRSGSTEKFMDAIFKLAPERVVYISCGPDTLGRDLEYFVKHKYKVDRIQPVDMFPHSEHVETVVLLNKVTRQGSLKIL